MSDVYVAIGSNVDPVENISKAATELARAFPGARFSSWYRNRAVGFEGDDFINGVVGFHTELALRAVIEKLHAVEALCGRPRNAPRWAPRSMDLDVLLYDRECDFAGTPHGDTVGNGRCRIKRESKNLSPRKITK